jgi:hypothetical protein
MTVCQAVVKPGCCGVAGCGQMYHIFPLAATTLPVTGLSQLFRQMFRVIVDTYDAEATAIFLNDS